MIATTAGGRLVLALDAALPGSGSVAVLRDRRIVAERDTAMRGAMSEELMPAIAAALAAAGAGPRDLSAIICGAGPGSFTSLRIAASLAKGLAAAASVPMFEASSLALIVAGARPAPPAGRYLAVLDALRGEHFAQIVHWSGSEITRVEDLEIHPAGVLDRLAAAREATLAGPGRSLNGAPHARGAAVVGAVLGGPVDLDAWEPLYGRPAEAQARWEATHRRPLPR